MAASTPFISKLIRHHNPSFGLLMFRTHTIPMAASNPSYYRSGGCQDIRMQKEHLFHLYMNQRLEGTPNGNQKVVANPSHPMLFGFVVANDWTIRDGPAADAKLVARARGWHIGAGKADESWLLCHSILFTDTREIRFKGSSLKVLGDFAMDKHGAATDGKWAIVGGTGEFAYANGVVSAKIIQNMHPTNGRIWELRIRAFCPCIPEVIEKGPWGGDGGTSFDIPEPPHSLQTVTIRCSDVINSIAFCYTNHADEKITAGPWGGHGALTATITLAQSETIKQVLGTTGTVGGDTVVTSLTLVSNVRTYGPFGKENGSAFSSQIPANKTVAGFHARAGASVNALGLYIA